MLPGHEGWTSAVWKDGAYAINEQGARRALVKLPGQADDETVQMRNWQMARGAQPRCTCGWTGKLRTGLNPRDRPDEHGCFPDHLQEELAIEWWEQHGDSVRYSLVEEAARDAAEAAAWLSKMVFIAHSTGASWKEIGDAVGITRQSAHQRWGKR